MRGIVNECSLLQPLASPVGSFRLAAPGSGLLGASAITATLMLHGVLAGIAAASSCLHLLWSVWSRARRLRTRRGHRQVPLLSSSLPSLDSLPFSLSAFSPSQLCPHLSPALPLSPLPLSALHVTCA